MTCLGCQLPESLNDRSVAFIWPPQGHTLYKIARFLEQRSVEFDNRVMENLLVARIDDGSRFIIDLSGLLTEAESRDTRLLLTTSETPSLSEFGEVMPLDRLVGRVRGDWLIDLLEEGRYTSFRQAVIDLKTEKPIGHEYLIRGYETDGSLVSPGALFESASDPRVFFNLDRAARLSAVNTAAKAKDHLDIFVNFMPGSVYDPNVCLRTTVNAIVNNEIDPSRVVFEIVESQRVDDLNHLRGIVNFYRKAGFRIALDDYGAGFNNVEALIHLEPDFLKLDKSLTRTLNDRPDKQDHVLDVVHRCKASGITVIAEGLETAEDAKTIADLGVPLGQGYHYGRPAPIDDAMSVGTPGDGPPLVDPTSLPDSRAIYVETAAAGDD